ncbi:hypothetical protein NFI96_014373, partial [Prochilodus magdalenae]
ELAPVPNLEVQDYQQNSSENYEAEQLRRTASEPILEQQKRRSVTRTRNIGRKSSAPTTDCPNTPVSEHTLPSRESDGRLLLFDCNTILYQQKVKQWQKQGADAGHPWPMMHIVSTPNFHMSGSAEPTTCPEECSTGLVFDSQMMKQQCVCGGSSLHPEHARTVLSKLEESGLRKQCKLIPEKKATMEEINMVFQENYACPYGTNPLGRFQLTAARTAAGSVTELALRVAQGELRNGFAIVNPRGHNTSRSEAMDFFSTALIAAKQLQNRVIGIKILIVDWDIHHDDSVQRAFYTDPKVLYVSLHHYDELSSRGGEPTEVGLDKGKGFNVNIAWTGRLDPPIGDAEYLDAFRNVIVPIALEFSPDVILVTSEFNAVEGHPAFNGGHKVSAICFGVLTQKLMDLAKGRVVLALEGGHDLTPVCDAFEACINALLKNKVEPLPDDVLTRKPCAHAAQSLQKVLHIHSEYWSSLREVPCKLSELYQQSERRKSTDSDAASALASLSMIELHQTTVPQQCHSSAALNIFRVLNSDDLIQHRRVQNEPMEHDENEATM